MISVQKLLLPVLSYSKSKQIRIGGGSSGRISNSLISSVKQCQGNHMSRRILKLKSR